MTQTTTTIPSDDATPTNNADKGIAGRTDYSTWSRRASDLAKEIDLEEEAERSSAAAALGLDGKHAFSQSEAEERTKAKQMKQAKRALEAYKKREGGVVQNLTGLLGGSGGESNPAAVACTSTAAAAAATVGQEVVNSRGEIKSSKGEVKYVTRDMIDAGKRVVSICDTSGPGKIVLTQDLSNLESVVPSSASSSQLQPKSYKDDAENEVLESSTTPSATTTAHTDEKKIARGIIKLSLRNLHNCTVIIKCKIITGTVEISHCTNVTVVAEGSDATVVTIQADMCQHLDIQFRDSPSGKNVTSLSPSSSSSTPSLYWGQDSSDRVYHAGVSNMRIATYRDGYVDLETKGIDYLADGAKAVGNASAEEVQFVTSVIDGEFVTEKAISGEKVGGSFPMTEREVKEMKKTKEQIQTALSEKMNDVIQIKEPSSSSSSSLPDDTSNTIENSEAASCNDNDEIVEEIYASATKDEVDAIIKTINDEKAKGNEAFTSGEYAQAILHYTMALDRAAELPDATAVNEWLTSAAATSTTTRTNTSGKLTQLFDRHIILSNRSACFLKLGHHDKALKDGTDAEILDPTYVKGIFRKGLALHAMGNYEKAIESLSSAQKIEPKNSQIKQALQFAEVRMTQELRKRMQG